MEKEEYRKCSQDLIKFLIQMTEFDIMDQYVILTSTFLSFILHLRKHSDKQEYQQILEDIHENFNKTIKGDLENLLKGASE